MQPELRLSSEPETVSSAMLAVGDTVYVTRENTDSFVFAGAILAVDLPGLRRQQPCEGGAGEGIFAALLLHFAKPPQGLFGNVTAGAAGAHRPEGRGGRIEAALPQRDEAAGIQEGGWPLTGSWR